LKEVDDSEDLGSFEERSALPTRFHAGWAVRPLQVHVSAARVGWVQVGSGTDPRLRHLRRVHSPPNYPRLSLRWEEPNPPGPKRGRETRRTCPRRPRRRRRDTSNGTFHAGEVAATVSRNDAPAGKPVGLRPDHLPLADQPAAYLTPLRDIPTGFSCRYSKRMNANARGYTILKDKLGHTRGRL
jgi:hypothetical protein